MHDYGKGAIAYFGDVNGEDETLGLVAAFIESRSPRLPIDCFAGLDETTFSALMQLKGDGNSYFQEDKLDEAITSYQSALEMFGSNVG